MTMLSALPALSERRRLRLAGFFLMYVSQGIPFGLVMTAIPAWLAFLVAAVSVGVGMMLCLLAGYGRMDTIRTPKRPETLSDPAPLPGVPAGAAIA